MLTPLLFFLLIIFPVGMCRDFNSRSVPNPMKSPSECGRPGVHQSAICDPSNFIKREQQDILEGLINTVNEVKGRQGNLQLSVLIVDKMSREHIGKDSIDNAAERFAKEIHNQWGIGDATSKPGVLIFLSIRDRAVFISAASRLVDHRRGILTDDKLDSIIYDMKYDLRRMEYFSAIQRAMIGIEIVVNGDDSALVSMKPEETPLQDALIVVLSFAALAGVVVLMVLYDERKGEAMKSEQRILTTFVRELDESKGDHGSGSSAYTCKTCPICMEELEYVSTEPKLPKIDELDVADDQFPDIDDIDTEKRSASEVGTPDTTPERGKERNDMNNDSAEEVGDKKKEGASDRTAVQLPCHHVFCVSCIAELEKSDLERRCPICRADCASLSSTSTGVTSAVESGTNNLDRRSGSVSSRNDTNFGSYFLRRGPELLYRIDRMRILNPAINQRTLRDMQTAVRSGDLNSLSHTVSSRVSNIQRSISRSAQNLGRSGRSGFSGSSWGGGSFGGGRGGRW